MSLEIACQFFPRAAGGAALLAEVGTPAAGGLTPARCCTSAIHIAMGLSAPASFRYCS